MKTVLLLESMFRTGGAERITYDIFTRLDPSRFCAVVATLYGLGPVGEKFRQAGVPCYSDLAAHRFDPRPLWRLPRIVACHHVDLVYVINQPLTLFWGFITARRCGLPVISAIHDTLERGTDRFMVFARLLKRVDRIVAVSAAQREHLLTTRHLDPAAVTLVQNGVLIDQQPKPSRDALRHQLGIDHGALVLGFVGRLVQLKGVDVLLRAMATTLAAFPSARLLVVGDGPERFALESLARELGIGSAVRFTGLRDDVRDLIDLFDVGVMPSRTEALPMALLEYMAGGKPVIATAVGSVTDLIDDGVHGLVVPPDDPARLAAGITELLSQPAHRLEMGARGLDVVRRRFDLAASVARTEQLIDETTSGRAAP